jgi:hypothetical protein
MAAAPGDEEDAERLGSVLGPAGQGENGGGKRCGKQGEDKGEFHGQGAKTAGRVPRERGVVKRETIPGRRRRGRKSGLFREKRFG